MDYKISPVNVELTKKLEEKLDYIAYKTQMSPAISSDIASQSYTGKWKLKQDMIKNEPNMEVIKENLLNHDSTIKEELEAGLKASDNLYENEEFLNKLVNNELTDLDSMDIVLIFDHLIKLEKKYYGYPHD